MTDQQRFAIDLTGATFTDKVLGCWLGKNCGGTLGTPMEEAWGRDEPFDVWWYPELQEGGLPNDDLEMQLVWLTALEQVGPDLTAADLARYWLDHIGYNFDEYGLSKTNLRLGLQPPVSGIWNNWFTDCMGSPIRSEIWACLAPGHPRIAARYAYQDAICDHAGGESVAGELYNAALQSAAFVVSDRELLLDIAESYLPPGSRTLAAVTAARAAHAAGVDWQTARRLVLEAAPSRIAQYSPVNLGFQVIGWLYGQDFGESMCITVNCGYDTDSSGGSVGSWLGIAAGRSGLPERWIEPFGLGISTNEPWGGVRHLTDGTTPIPTEITGLTERIVVAADRVLRHNGVRIDRGRTEIELADLYADDAVRRLWSASPWLVDLGGRHRSLTVDYRGEAAARPETTQTIGVLVSNPHPDPITVDLAVAVPTGWSAAWPERVELDAAGSTEIEVSLRPGTRADVEGTNVVVLDARATGYPVDPPAAVALVGAQAWRWRPLIDGETLDDTADLTGSAWSTIAVGGNELPIADLLTGHDRVVVQTFLESAIARPVRLAVDATVSVRYWVNGALIAEVPGPRLIRPSYGLDSPGNVIVDLTAGWNELTVEFTAVPDTVPAAHCFVSTPDQLRNGVVDLGRTRFPWD